jgi:hypothetical protein
VRAVKNSLCLRSDSALHLHIGLCNLGFFQTLPAFVLVCELSFLWLFHWWQQTPQWGGSEKRVQIDDLRSWSNFRSVKYRSQHWIICNFCLPGRYLVGTVPAIGQKWRGCYTSKGQSSKGARCNL